MASYKSLYMTLISSATFSSRSQATSIQKICNSGLDFYVFFFRKRFASNLWNKNFYISKNLRNLLIKNYQKHVGNEITTIKQRWTESSYVLCKLTSILNFLVSIMRQICWLFLVLLFFKNLLFKAIKCGSKKQWFGHSSCQRYEVQKYNLW